MRLWLTTTAVFAGLAGCGGDSASQPEDKGAAGARAAVIQFIDAVVDGRGEQACDLMTAKAREQVGRNPEGKNATACESVMKFARIEIKGREDKLKDQAQAAKIRVTGNRARMAPFEGDTQPTILVRERGRWLVSE